MKVRARWRHLPKENIIEIYEIPYSTTVEAVIDKVAELVKAGKLREVADMRDETDLSGLKLAIDLKRGADPEQVMQKLFRLTPLCDSFACNFNILIAGNPRVMGVGEILDEWIAWRMECIRRRVFFDLQKKRAKLHLLQGLGKILLDIDRAIAIIRNTEREADVVPNLMAGFDLDEVQANFVAEIKLRNINREYILKRTAETDALEKRHCRPRGDAREQAPHPRHHHPRAQGDHPQVPVAAAHGIVAAESVAQMPDEDLVPDYPVQLFLSREGYFKKITPQSLRMSGEQKYKDGDALSQSFGATNRGNFSSSPTVNRCIRPSSATLRTRRRPCSACTCRRCCPWMPTSTSCAWSTPATTAASCCWYLKTARPRAFPCRRMRPRRTAAA